MKKRQYRSRQGRSDSKYLESYKTIAAAFILFLAAMVIYLLVNLFNL